MGESGLRLSVLDQSPISAGGTGAQALRNSVDLARHADRLGYHRYWVAEHHGSPALACASPEVLIGPIAAATSGIRVGSGGVMLPHYSPLKVAENFSILGGLFPGRIDLGIGRAPGTDGITSLALQRDRRRQLGDELPEQLAELRAYFEGRIKPDHPFAKLMVLPGRPELPALWLLGSSLQSAIWAGEQGLPYMFADFINRDGAEATKLYRARFEPSATLDHPMVGVAAGAVCAETAAAADRLAASVRMIAILLRSGGDLPEIPPPEEALAFLAANEPTARAVQRSRRMLVGTPDTVREGIEALAAEYGAEEAMVLTVVYDHAARVRSCELIAAAFGLQPRG